jgi:hypothetical protein
MHRWTGREFTELRLKPTEKTSTIESIVSEVIFTQRRKDAKEGIV